MDSRPASAPRQARAQADVSGNGYLEGAEVGRILERMRAGGRGVTAGEIRNVMRQARPERTTCSFRVVTLVAMALCRPPSMAHALSPAMSGWG